MTMINIANDGTLKKESIKHEAKNANIKNDLYEYQKTKNISIKKAKIYLSKTQNIS